MLILGDSLGIDMGGPLQNDLANTGVVQATLDARESTGLDSTRLLQLAGGAAERPGHGGAQVVVVMIGANDPQDFPGPPDVPYSSPQWNVLYAGRCRGLHAPGAERRGHGCVGGHATDAEPAAFERDGRH